MHDIGRFTCLARGVFYARRSMVPDQIFLLGHVEYVLPYEYWVAMGRRQPELRCWMQERRRSRVVGGHFRPCMPELNQRRPGNQGLCSATQKEVKVIRWNEYEGGLWFPMLVGRNSGLLEG